MSRRSRKYGWQAKEWYNVLAPKMFGEEKVGETPADDPEKVIGRVIETTIGTLTGDFSKNNTKVYFKVKEISGKNARTQFVGHELTSDYIGSLTRRRTNRIDTTVDVLTKDGYKVRAKPVLFTVKKGKSSQKKGLRKESQKILKEKAQELRFNQFIQELVLGKIASEIYNSAKKIYSLRRSEIRKSEVLSEPEEIEEIPEGFEEVAEEAGVAIEE